MPTFLEDRNLALQPTHRRSALSSQPLPSGTYFAFARLDGCCDPSPPAPGPLLPPLRTAGNLLFGCRSTILMAQNDPCPIPSLTSPVIPRDVLPPAPDLLCGMATLLPARECSGVLISWPRRTWPCWPRPISRRMTYWLIILRPESSRANWRSAVSRLEGERAGERAECKETSKRRVRHKSRKARNENQTK